MASWNGRCVSDGGSGQVWRADRPDSGKCAPDRGRAKLVWGLEPDSGQGAPDGGPCMHIDSVLEELVPLDHFRESEDED